MTAEQARTIAYEKNVSATDSQYAKALKEVDIAARLGHYTTTLGELLIPDVSKKLRALGYKISQYDGSQFDNASTTISWGLTNQD